MNKSSRRLNGSSMQNKSNGRLIKVYSKLIQLLWIKASKQSKQYVHFFPRISIEPPPPDFSDIINPSSIAIEIRGINPSFRSYTQQVNDVFFSLFD